MACVVCQHCQGRLSKESVAIRQGFSYHKKCHKCYVCSETNLKNAEVFKGVIFCSGCSQRIFQGCSTARNSKNGKSKACKIKAKRRRRIPQEDKTADRGRYRHVSGVLELTQLAASSGSDSSNPPKTQTRRSDSSASSKKLAYDEEKEMIAREPKDPKRNSAEMGMTTEVTHELLRQMNCPVVEDLKKTYKSPPLKCPPKEKGDSRYNKTVICSDLRIAELGASTEIAHMALRKKSELPVIIKSTTKEMESPSVSGLNQDSDISGDNEWLESTSSLKQTLRSGWFDRRLGSLIKMPYNFFKRNILNRSSLVSVPVSNGEANCAPLNRLKILFHEEITDHQHRGVKRLYSTINRRRAPYKLGWLNLMAKVSAAMSPQITIRKEIQDNHTRCKHFRRSHSYRCMRAQVMRLAGPTKSELACFRGKVKNAFLPPGFLRDLVTYNNKTAAILMSQACGNDDHILTTHS